MPLVILQENWRTPLGRFDKNDEGRPVEIPKKVLRRYALPRSAVLVGEDYVHEDDQDNEEMTVSPEELDALVEKRLQERMAQEKGEELLSQGQGQEEDEDEDEDEDDGLLGILDKSVPKIKAALNDYSVAELKELLTAEENGNTRKGVVLAIEAELEERGE